MTLCMYVCTYYYYYNCVLFTLKKKKLVVQYKKKKKKIWKTYIQYSLYYVACLVCQSASQTSMESLHAEEVLVKMFEVSGRLYL